MGKRSVLFGDFFDPVDLTSRNDDLPTKLVTMVNRLRLWNSVRLTWRMYGLTLPSISLAVSISNMEGYSRWPTSHGFGHDLHGSVETGMEASCRSDTILSWGVLVNMRDFMPLIRELTRCFRLSMLSNWPQSTVGNVFK